MRIAAVGAAGLSGLRSGLDSDGFERLLAKPGDLDLVAAEVVLPADVKRLVGVSGEM